VKALWLPQGPEGRSVSARSAFGRLRLQKPDRLTTTVAASEQWRNMTDNLPAVPESEHIDPRDVPSESRGWAVAAHLLPFVSLAIIGPLFVWLIKRDEDEYVEAHAREALNFQLSMLIYGLVSALLIIVLIGIVLLLAVGVFSLVFAILAAIKAANGEPYEYPLTMRMVKQR
jgi:uncharacterized Tic20 family protein